MSNSSKFAERFRGKIQLQGISRVSTGAPVRLSLISCPQANIPKAAKTLVKRHLPLRTAHAALTEMYDFGETVVTVPCVEDLEVLKTELLTVGVTATPQAPELLKTR